MLQRFESSFRGYDEAELFYQIWQPEGARGTIVLTHGIAEHSDCYHPFAKRMADEGWETFAWDLRGHGKSEGKRGFVRNFNEYEKDLFRLYDEVQKERSSSGPTILFGHSMGGLISARAVLEYGPLDMKALCLSSPAFGLALKVPKIKDQVARVANRWLPSLTLHNEIRYEDLSRDEDMLKLYPSDPLRHDKVCPAIYLGMLESFEMFKARAKEIRIPLLMQSAGKDKMVSLEASNRFYQNVGSEKKEIHIYPDSLHEIYNDLDRDLAFADLKKFINSFLGQK